PLREADRALDGVEEGDARLVGEDRPEGGEDGLGDEAAVDGVEAQDAHADEHDDVSHEVVDEVVEAEERADLDRLAAALVLLERLVEIDRDLRDDEEAHG